MLNSGNFRVTKQIKHLKQNSFCKIIQKFAENLNLELEYFINLPILEIHFLISIVFLDFSIILKFLLELQGRGVYSKVDLFCRKQTQLFVLQKFG